ncbi:MAG: hypothetical protein V3V04_00305 [Rhizobiaceae bacterium]
MEGVLVIGWSGAGKSTFSKKLANKLGAHVVAFAMKEAKNHPGKSILINLSGRGDKDIDFVTEKYGFGE